MNKQEEREMRAPLSSLKDLKPFSHYVNTIQSLDVLVTCQCIVALRDFYLGGSGRAKISRAMPKEVLFVLLKVGAGKGKGFFFSLKN